MTHIEKLTYNAIAQIEHNKRTFRPGTNGRTVRIEPSHALLHEILQMMKDTRGDDVRVALRSLCRSGKVTYGQTINDVYFKIISHEATK